MLPTTLRGRKALTTRSSIDLDGISTNLDDTSPNGWRAQGVAKVATRSDGGREDGLACHGAMLAMATMALGGMWVTCCNAVRNVLGCRWCMPLVAMEGSTTCAVRAYDLLFLRSELFVGGGVTRVP